jgi:hypothetical protein
VSFDIVLQCFENGGAADADGPTIRAVLEPLVTETAEGFARVETEDGGTDVYGLDHPEQGLMLNHAEGRRIWDVIVDVARAGGLVIMPVGCPSCVVDPDLAGHLPPEAPAARIVGSGAEVLAIVEGA